MARPPGRGARRHHRLDARQGPQSGRLPPAQRPKAGCGFPRLNLAAGRFYSRWASIRSCGCIRPGASRGGAASAWAQPIGCWSGLSPATLPVRRVRLQARLQGFRTHSVVVATTLGDPVAYPPQALAELYLQGWGVALHSRELKTLRRLEILGCRSPQRMRKELLLHWIASNLVRAVMLQAALCYPRALKPARVSKAGWTPCRPLRPCCREAA
jgi:hypothetical protein